MNTSGAVSVLPGQLWLERRRDLPDHRRRVVKVISVDVRRVSLAGWYQEATTRGGWVDDSPRRNSRVLCDLFMSRFRPMEGAER